MLKKLFNPETLGALYISLYSLLAPITHTVKGGSTVILVGSLVFVFVLLFITKRLTKVVSDYSFFVKATFLVGFLFLFDYVLRPNRDISDLMYSFIIYGIFTLYFLSSVSNYDIFLRRYCTFSILCGVIMLLDPLQNYAWSGGYMPFGFQFILPAFASSIVLVFHYHVKSAIVLVVIFFMTMLIFANKGSILAALILLFVGVTYIKNGYHISRKVVISSLLFLIFFLLAYSEILNLALSIMDKLGVDSYALATIQIMLEDTSNNSVYDTRLNIWQDALTFFSKSPIIGCGIGYYSSQRDVYEHNLFLEVLNAWGIVGLFLLTIIFYKCYNSFVTAHTPALKLLMILFIILGFVPLMSSLTLWRYTPFWIILALSFRKKQKSRS